MSLGSHLPICPTLYDKKNLNDSAARDHMMIYCQVQEMKSRPQILIFFRFLYRTMQQRKKFLTNRMGQSSLLVSALHPFILVQTSTILPTRTS